MLKFLTVNTAIILALVATFSFTTLGLLGVQIESSYIVATAFISGTILLVAVWRGGRRVIRRLTGKRSD